jgi:hypothetical protein
VINVHSANSSAARKMEQGIKQIRKLHDRFNRPSSSRVASLYLMASRPGNTINVNVWDDSPPGAPIHIEGALPQDAEFTKAQVYNFLAGAAMGAGYKIKAKTGLVWGQTSRFHVAHPTMNSYDDAVDNKAHTDFLDDLVVLFSGLEYGGFKFNVYSES